MHIPLLRAGEPYRSLSTYSLTDVRTGEAIAEVSLANPGLIARDLQAAGDSFRALANRRVEELLAICRRAAELFAAAELPVGDTLQGPRQYLEDLAATTGLPQSLGRRNMEKIRFVLANMATVLAGLTRGLEPRSLDAGWGVEGERCVSFRRETDALGVVLPSNSPGVHSLWLPAIPLKVALVLKPGSQEPWTPHRVARALLAAGCPPSAIGFYPTDYPGATEILLRCGRSMLFGDRSTVETWRNDPRIQIHGPGWSKVILGADGAEDWRSHLDLLVQSVAENGGRSCINASAVWSAARGREIAVALAERLAAIPARPLDHPDAELAAFPSERAARRLSEVIDAQLRVAGATDLTAELRRGGRVVEAGGCWFVLPTVIHCDDPEHPLARVEFPFPFVAVVEAPPDELVDRIGPTLVATVLSGDQDLLRKVLESTDVERLNFGPVPTSRVDWDQPHEGNLFEHLYRQRALQGANLAFSKAGSRRPATGGAA